MSRRLDVFLSETHAGVLEEGTDGRVAFLYDENRVGDDRLPALSLSMPSTARRHGGGTVLNWLWNLLPDRQYSLDRIAADTSRGFRQVSPGNPMALLEKVGEDCAGAVQLVRPDRLTVLDQDQFQPVGDLEIAGMLRELRTGLDVMGRRRSDRGRFSLPGAQPKTALHLDPSTGWGIPSGRLPTTHILKPPIPGIQGQVENEHFCLDLAFRLDFAVAPTSVRYFEDEIAIVVTRYDRARLDDGRVARLHQEDMCQALGVPPSRKYQADKGPGIHAIVSRVLQASLDPQADRSDFMRAVALNFILGGTDAHAKNYSVFLLGDRLRFAPLYDINSMVPEGLDPDMRLSMSVDRHYEFGRILPRHWFAQAAACGMDGDMLLQDIRDLLLRMPDEAAATLSACRTAGLTTPVLTALADGLAVRCSRLAEQYGSEELVRRSALRL